MPPIKLHNKKLRRRLEGLTNKCYEYGKLDDITLALIVYNEAKGSLYTYISDEKMRLWLRMDDIVSQTLASILVSNLRKSVLIMLPNKKDLQK